MGRMGADEVLQGGMANAGAVVRVGDTVRRPRRSNSDSVAALLQHLETVGFSGAPRYLGTDDKDRDVFTFIEGDVPIPPFPSWIASDDAVQEVARLLAEYHAASASFEWAGHRWSDELRDEGTPELVCHNDVCPENVVFRNGRAVALLDFDFAAPGRRLWDGAMAIRMWGALPNLDGARIPADVSLRLLAAFAKAFQVPHAEAAAFVDAVWEAHRCGSRFVQRRLEAREPAYERKWSGSHEARAKTAEGWFVANRERLIAAVAEQ